MDPLTRYAGALPKGEPALSPAARELSRRASLPSHPLRGSSPKGRACPLTRYAGALPKGEPLVLIPALFIQVVQMLKASIGFNIEITDIVKYKHRV